MMMVVMVVEKKRNIYNKDNSKDGGKLKKSFNVGKTRFTTFEGLLTTIWALGPRRILKPRFSKMWYISGDFIWRKTRI